MKKYLPLFGIMIILISCKKKEKPPVTVPVEFNSTTYQALGAYDSSGTPGYLLPKDAVSTDLQSYVNNILVEKSDLRKTHPELLSTNAIADLEITQPADVFITFVSQVTTSKNALAFYTYPANHSPASPTDIDTITYIFPSIGLGTKLQTGDKVKIGRFDAGTSIGFVLLRDAWDPAARTINTDVVHFCSNDILNPEVDPALKKHAVLINYPHEKKLLIGFENTNRTAATADHDFNDVIIYATVTP